jgi:hypothetical protein
MKYINTYMGLYVVPIRNYAPNLSWSLLNILRRKSCSLNNYNQTLNNPILFFKCSSINLAISSWKTVFELLFQVSCTISNLRILTLHGHKRESVNCKSIFKGSTKKAVYKSRNDTVLSIFIIQRITLRHMLYAAANRCWEIFFFK